MEGTGLERSRTITQVEVSVLTAPGSGACAEMVPLPDFFKATQIRFAVLASVVVELAGQGEPTILLERRATVEQPASSVEVAVDVVDAAERAALAQRLADAGRGRHHRRGGRPATSSPRTSPPGRASPC